MKRKVLIVEDYLSLARVLCHNLNYEGFEVVAANNGLNALRQAEAQKPDLVLLDLMLPGLDGLEVCRSLTCQAPRMGLIIISARNQKRDKLEAFQLGADDYVTKPFTLDELLARVHAVLRRLRPSAESLVLGDLTIDFIRYSASNGHRALPLSHRELEVLHYMSERLGQTVTREELLQRVWGSTTCAPRDASTT